MIRLLIDGQRVNLSEDISLEFYNRNPFLTSEGMHTLDIDISLADPQNAKVYRHLHRIDVMRPYEGRTAILYYEKGVIIRGTEIILETDGKSVKIQIVAGNSEFNYIAGNDKHLHDLDLGAIDSLDEATALASLHGSYPEWDYVCTPVCTEVTFRSWVENVMHSGFDTYSKAKICNEIEAAKEAASVRFKSGTRLCAQPYLAAIVRRVLQALGYTLVDDFIGTHKELSRLVVVHGHDTLEYGKMVENWTVDKFFSEVEKLCGVLFIVDNTRKEVSVMNGIDYYRAADVENIAYEDIIADISKDFDETPPENIVYKNVSYKLPETNIYKFYAIDEELMKKVTTVGVTLMNWSYNLHDIWRYIVGDNSFETSAKTPQQVKDAYNKMFAYTLTLGFNTHPYGEFPFVVAYSADNYSCLKMINQFGPRLDETADDKLELSLVPVENIWCFRSGNNTGAGSYLGYSLPLAENTDADTPSSTADDSVGLIDCIHDGEDGGETVKDTMFMAFYMGICPDVYGQGFVTPIAASSRLVQYVESYLYTGTLFWQHQSVFTIDADGDYDLSINSSKGMYNKYWKQQLSASLKSVCTIKFRSLQLRDSRHIFNICNRNFYCQELKYEIVNGRLSDVVEGTFYPVD